MKWLVLIIIVAAVVFWLYRGKRSNVAEDPDATTFDEKDYYLNPGDKASNEASPRDGDNPRH